MTTTGVCDIYYRMPLTNLNPVELSRAGKGFTRREQRRAALSGRW
ncbi:hypothetical protein NJ7G_0173 [Natrinema sp. J7-2]|nr:hypothetical protein NJ7G_0173 [Natrinema sp. J7-2]